MSIEIKQMSIKSNVVQRKADDVGGCGERASTAESEPGEDWRAECRRMIQEVLNARAER